MGKINLQVLTLCLILVLLSVSVYAAELNGRVRENTKKEGIPGLVVKLKPPKASQKPEKITKTGKNGEFVIKDLDTGKYMLEVYEATTIIYREVLELNSDTTKEIELEKK
ncbi:MAG: hypothetical protein AB1498_01460 [bacterium]